MKTSIARRGFGLLALVSLALGQQSISLPSGCYLTTTVITDPLSFTSMTRPPPSDGSVTTTITESLDSTSGLEPTIDNSSGDTSFGSMSSVSNTSPSQVAPSSSSSVTEPPLSVSPTYTISSVSVSTLSTTATTTATATLAPGEPFFITVNTGGPDRVKRAILYVAFDQAGYAILVADKAFAAVFIVDIDGNLRTGDKFVGATVDPAGFSSLRQFDEPPATPYSWSVEDGRVSLGDSSGDAAFCTYPSGNVVVVFDGQPPPGCDGVAIAPEPDPEPTSTTTRAPEPTTGPSDQPGTTLEPPTSMQPSSPDGTTTRTQQSSTSTAPPVPTTTTRPAQSSTSTAPPLPTTTRPAQSSTSSPPNSSPPSSSPAASSSMSMPSSSVTNTSPAPPTTTIAPGTGSASASSTRPLTSTSALTSSSVMPSPSTSQGTGQPSAPSSASTSATTNSPQTSSPSTTSSTITSTTRATTTTTRPTTTTTATTTTTTTTATTTTTRTTTTTTTAVIYSAVTCTVGTRTIVKPAQTSTPAHLKRGLAHRNVTTLQFYGPTWISFAHNYFYRPNNTDNVGIFPPSAIPAMRFYPTVFNAKIDLNNWINGVADSIEHYGADTLFAFNEPDLCGDANSACMPVSEALAGWAKYMEPFKDCGIKLASPAIGNAGQSLTWLREFMGNATQRNYTVGILNMHHYSYPYDGGVKVLMNYTSAVHAIAPSLPVWVTEYGVDGGNLNAPETIKQQFLKDSMMAMHKADYIGRFCDWGNFKGLLLNADGSGLSALGQIYNTYYNTSEPRPIA